MQPTKFERILSILTALALVLILAHAWPNINGGPLGTARAAEGDSNFTNVVASGDITVGDDLTVTDDMTVDALTAADLTASDDLVVTDDATITDDLTVTSDLNVDGNVDLDDGVINQDQDTENVGALPTVLSVPVTTTDLTLATIGAGEIWIVHDVFMNVTTNYDCSGDDCDVDIGDGNDADGFLNLNDAALQAADVGGPTGFPAGWQGFLAAEKGVYFDEATSEAHHNMIYVAADTIDFDFTGTSPTAGAGVVYIIYTRLQ
jgi:hypothetical protein